jgi:hypothetical protein
MVGRGHRARSPARAHDHTFVKRVMGQALRLSISLVGIVVIAAPLSILTTILLFPFWSWLEASAGIEAVGHSGPAGWCYAVVFLVVAMSGALIVFIRHRVKVGGAA